MLRVCSSMSGELLEEVPISEVENQTVRFLKDYLAPTVKVTRFCQRLFRDDQNELSEEDLLPSVSNVLLTCLAFAAPDDENFQALCAACRGSRAAELETLLRSPIDPNLKGVVGFTALHYAAGNGSLQCLSLLLEARADHNAAVFEDGATPLHLAAGEGKVEVVQKLLESRAALEMTLHCGRTALHCAAQEGQAEVVRLLLDAQAEKDTPTQDDHCSPLTLASSRGYLDVVRLLIEASADVDYSLPWSEGFGTTALHMAATSGFAEVVQALLKGGATKDKAVSGGLTPLHVACRFGRLEVVRALIEAGAERNAATSQDGKKPLELAMEFGHHEVVHFLRAPLNDLSVDSLPPSTPDTGFVSAE